MARRRLLLSTAIGLALVASGPLRAGLPGTQKVEAQIGVRLSQTPPANARIGTTYEGIVVDAAKLSARGFPGVKQNDHVTLKITGPHGQFDVVHAALRLTRSFELNAQGVVSPRVAAPAPAK